MTISVSLDKRLDKVVREREKMRRNGVVHRVGPDGLIRTRARLIRPRFPFQGAMIIVVLFMAFKALLFAQMGTGTYNARVDVLQAGSTFEKAGAVLMQEDRVTVAVGSFLKQYIFQR
jgi:hypothetical protein